MLLDYLDTVRLWPIAKRKRFAMTLSVGLTGIIVLLWLSVMFMGPDPQSTASAERPIVPVATEQESLGMWERLRASIGMTPTADTPNQPDESPALREISPEALSEFHSTFDEPEAPASVATTTLATPSASSTARESRSAEILPEPEENGSMVESVLEEVGR